jgi:hypothetical protein
MDLAAVPLSLHFNGQTDRVVCINWLSFTWKFGGDDRTSRVFLLYSAGF